MTITPEAFLPFINEALDGMVAIAEGLGDERVNRRPDLPNTNSPFAILTHCWHSSIYWPPVYSAYASERITVLFTAIL